MKLNLVLPLAGAFLVAGVGALGCAKTQLASVPAEPAPGTANQVTGDNDGMRPTTAGQSVTGTADFALEPKALYEECEKNAAAAQAKYGDKVVELTGEVREVKAALDLKGGTIYLYVGADKDDVWCSSKEGQPWAQVAPGSRVKFRGKLVSAVLRPELDDCVVLEASPNPALALTSDQLAREYAADPQATNKKYDGKTLIVEGKVAEVQDEDTSMVRVFLKTDGNVRVLCTFALLQVGAVAPKVDQKIKVVGRYAGAASKDTVALSQALPIQ